MMDLTPFHAAPLAAARAVSDSLHQHEPIPGLQVTELSPEAGRAQWRLAFSLYERAYPTPEARAWAPTAPAPGDFA